MDNMGDTAELAALCSGPFLPPPETQRTEPGNQDAQKNHGKRAAESDPPQTPPPPKRKRTEPVVASLGSLDLAGGLPPATSTNTPRMRRYSAGDRGSTPVPPNEDPLFYMGLWVGGVWRHGPFSP